MAIDRVIIPVKADEFEEKILSFLTYNWVGTSEIARALGKGRLNPSDSKRLNAMAENDKIDARYVKSSENSKRGVWEYRARQNTE
jgi:hypothetical protein